MNNSNKIPSSRKTLITAVLTAFALAGCGGGGGGATPDAPVEIAPDAPASAPAPVPELTPQPDPVAAPVNGANSLVPSCTNCSAISANRYSGSGVGIWHKTNTGTTDQDIDVSIAGLRNSNVTLILTNETNSDVVMPAIPMTSVVAQSVMLPSANAAYKTDQATSVIDTFNRKGWKDIPLTKAVKVSANHVSGAASDPSAPRFSIIGDIRTFNDENDKPRTTSLQKQFVMPDGFVIQFWVESSEIGSFKMTPSVINQIAESFASTNGIYDMLKNTGGPLWGPHAYSELVAGSSNVLDIVLINIKNDNQPIGLVGYFYSLNNFKKSVIPTSNESLSLYVDTESIYLGGEEGIKRAKMTLAHEGMHMSNFYRRGIKISQSHQYDVWLDEMTAMMMEDAVGDTIDPSFNAIRDVRYPNYLLTKSYNCPLMTFTGFGAVCESYSVSGSFGGFLLRQMGMPFFKNLLDSTVPTSEAVVQASIIKSRPDSSLGRELRHFAVAAIPGLELSAAPAGFGFPSRVDDAYVIPSINSKSMMKYRLLPTSSPQILSAYASFPVVRNGVSGTYSTTVRVPKGASLSVVVSD